MEDLKKRIACYWNGRAEDFHRQSLAEMQNNKVELWQRELELLLPPGPCKILDIGTGSGYMAMVAASLGHKVTGVDLSAAMLAKAESLKEELKLDCTFIELDGEALPFAEGVFDAVLTRNLTWTLPHIVEAYREWYRVLGPGGVLLNFDADYGKSNFYRPEQEYSGGLHGRLQAQQLQECDSIKNSLEISRHRRPQWDAVLLQECGFVKVVLDFQLGARIAGSTKYKGGMFGLYAYK